MKNKNNKQIILTVVIFVLIVALIAAGLLVLKKHKSRTEDPSEMPIYTRAGVSGDEYVTSRDRVPVPGETVPARQAATAAQAGTTAAGSAATTAAQTGTTAANGASTTKSSAQSTTKAPSGGSGSQAPDTSAELRDINAFINGVFTMDGTIVDGEEGQRIKLSKDHSSLKAGMDIDGMELTLLYTNGKTYLVNDTDRKFTEFGEAMASLLGVEASEFTDMFGGSLDFFDENETRFDNGVRSESTYNGQKAVQYDFAQASGDTIRFTLVGGNLKRLSVVDEAGGDDYGIIFNSFSGNLPTNTFSLAGYEKQSLMDFMSAMDIEGLDGN